MTNPKNILLKIANKHFFESKERNSLETKHNGEEDFFEVTIWSLREALEDAFHCGIKEGKKHTVTWNVTGYIGFSDYDGPEDYNLKLQLEMDKSVTKEELEILLFERYKKYRVVVLEVSCKTEK